jgi:hypothetical protein
MMMREMQADASAKARVDRIRQRAEALAAQENKHKRTYEPLICMSHFFRFSNPNVAT